MIQFIVFLVLLIIGLCSCAKGSSFADIFFKKNNNKTVTKPQTGQPENLDLQSTGTAVTTGENKYWIWSRKPTAVK